MWSKTTKDDKKYIKYSTYELLVVFHLLGIFDLAQHLQSYATTLSQNPLPTGPQYNLVAHARATSAGHGVLDDL